MPRYVKLSTSSELMPLPAFAALDQCLRKAKEVYPNGAFTVEGRRYETVNGDVILHVEWDVLLGDTNHV